MGVLRDSVGNDESPWKTKWKKAILQTWETAAGEWFEFLIVM